MKGGMRTDQDQGESFKYTQRWAGLDPEKSPSQTLIFEWAVKEEGTHMDKEVKKST